MRNKRGRPQDADTVYLINKFREIIYNKPIWGEELRNKVKSYYEQKGIPYDDKKVINKVGNIVKKLKREHELKTKKRGRETLYYFPQQEEKAEEIIIMEKEGLKGRIELSEKFLPVVKEWLKEFPRIEEYDFGVYIPTNTDKIVYAKEFRKLVIDNMERIVDVDDKDNKNNGQILLPFCNDIHGRIIKLDIERNPLFEELLKENKTLNYKWGKFKKLSAELWEKIQALQDNITEMAVKEFGLLISKPYVPGNVIDTVSYKISLFLSKIIFHDLINIAEYWNIEIYGVKIGEKEMVFKTDNLFLWDGDKFSQVKKYKLTVYSDRETIEEKDAEEKDADAADTFILRINGEGMICLSRQWLVKNYIKNYMEKYPSNSYLPIHMIDSQIQFFADFCISHINKLIQKIREGPVFQEAKEIYKVQKKLWEIYRELRDILENKIKFNQY